MLKILKLFLPAIIPSWRFFDAIAPSPRIEFTTLNIATDTPTQWQEFRPRPAHISFAHMLKRMLWNPEWNETLFLVSCAERLTQNPTAHSENEIFQRLIHDLKRRGIHAPFIQFRLVFISRQGARIEKCVTYTSPVQTVVL